MRLSELNVGDYCIIKRIDCADELKNHLEEIGFLVNAKVEVLFIAPFKYPILYKINNFRISLSQAEANCIFVEKLEKETTEGKNVFTNKCKDCKMCFKKHNITCERKNISVVLIGNPNCGKTTLFNLITSDHERIGNYDGVTVCSKSNNIYFENYKINIVDLPGIRSLNTFGDEEKIAKEYLLTKKIDIVINIIDSINIKRNLYLTTQLLDLGFNVVCAFNFFDKFQENGFYIDFDKFDKSLNVKSVPIVAETGFGVKKLIETVIDYREKFLIKNVVDCKDKKLESEKNKNIKREKTVKERYSFIDNILQQANFISGDFSKINISTNILDKIFLNKYYGLFLFLFFIFLMFKTTFSFGSVLSSGLSFIINNISFFINNIFPQCFIKDLILNGVFTGVNAIIVFIPQIFILYCFIFFMEDSGYINRAVFLIDKIMRKVGLHGESFISIITSFGCNVPGVLATRTIKNKKDKIITCMIIPMMSCPAKLPVYILLSGLFFSGSWQIIIVFSLYLLGIFVSIICSKILNLFIKDPIETFIIEFPQYKIPNIFSLLKHSFNNVKHFLINVGSIVVFVSILLWSLEYFPQRNNRDISESYIGKIGERIEPAMKGSGFNWKLNVSLLSGIIAKETIVPVLTLFYKKNIEDTDVTIKKRMTEDGINIFVIIAFLIFVLFYFPCFGTLFAIKNELGVLWMLFCLLLNTGIAFFLSFLILRISSIFI